jgi:type IX secretion system PorP/SprF family membrane protein
VIGVKKGLLYKGIGLVVIYMLYAQASYAQISILPTMPEVNKYLVNPAYAGLESSLDINVWGREQWQGVDGGPSTQGISVHMPVYILNGGLGLKIINDRLGPFHNSRVELGYSYVKLYDYSILTVGISAGFTQYKIDGEKLRSPEGAYLQGLILHNDPLLPETELSGLIPTLSIGAWYVADVWEGGLAVQSIHPFGTKLEDAEGGHSFDWRESAQVTAFGEYRYPLRPDVMLLPSFYFTSDFKRIQLQAKLSALLFNRMRPGLGIRGYSGTSLESLIISAGYMIDEHLTFYYSYDIGVSGLAKKTSGTHEIILNYNLNRPIGKGKKPVIIYNPRFL